MPSLFVKTEAGVICLTFLHLFLSILSNCVINLHFLFTNCCAKENKRDRWLLMTLKLVIDVICVSLPDKFVL